MKLSLHPKARMRVLDGEAVIIHQGIREAIGLNRTGTRVLERVVAGTAPAEVASELRAPPGEVERFVSELVDAGILVEEGA